MWEPPNFAKISETLRYCGPKIILSDNRGYVVCCSMVCAVHVFYYCMEFEVLGRRVDAVCTFHALCRRSTPRSEFEPIVDDSCFFREWRRKSDWGASDNRSGANAEKELERFFDPDA